MDERSGYSLLTHIRSVREPDFCVEVMKTGAPGNTGMLGEESREPGGSSQDCILGLLIGTRHLGRQEAMTGWMGAFFLEESQFHGDLLLGDN